jgi:hypothetical protein
MFTSREHSPPSLVIFILLVRLLPHTLRHIIQLIMQKQNPEHATLISKEIKKKRWVHLLCDGMTQKGSFISIGLSFFRK